MANEFRILAVCHRWRSDEVPPFAPIASVSHIGLSVGRTSCRSQPWKPL